MPSVKKQEPKVSREPDHLGKDPFASIAQRPWITGIFSALFWIVFVLALALGLPKILSWTLKTPYPVATITSQSMWPSLKRGDLVFISKARAGEVMKGRVIVFRRHDSFVIHRVVRLAGNSVITKGDANTIEDAPVDPKTIIGIVPIIRGRLAKIPYLGKIALLTSKKQPRSSED